MLIQKSLDEKSTLFKVFSSSKAQTTRPKIVPTYHCQDSIMKKKNSNYVW